MARSDMRNSSQGRRRAAGRAAAAVLPRTDRQHGSRRHLVVQEPDQLPGVLAGRCRTPSRTRRKGGACSMLPRRLRQHALVDRRLSQLQQVEQAELPGATCRATARYGTLRRGVVGRVELKPCSVWHRARSLPECDAGFQAPAGAETTTSDASVAVMAGRGPIRISTSWILVGAEVAGGLRSARSRQAAVRVPPRRTSGSPVALPHGRTRWYHRALCRPEAAYSLTSSGSSRDRSLPSKPSAMPMGIFTYLPRASTATLSS